jgi:hypothetical protein
MSSSVEGFTPFLHFPIVALKGLGVKTLAFLPSTGSFDTGKRPRAAIHPFLSVVDVLL